MRNANGAHAHTIPLLRSRPPEIKPEFEYRIERLKALEIILNHTKTI